jgi:cell division protein FtsW (lipid II flippase)
MKMTLRLMVPVTFFSMLGFFFSTLVKNGNGSAVLMVLVGLAAWIMSDTLQASKWNVFLNPFQLPRNMSETVYQSVVESNQLIFLIAALIALLWGLINLQNREKFV